MSVFNSLGSNYSFRFAVKSLFARGSKQTADTVVKKLSEHYNGIVTLTYKGRHALELACKTSGLPAGSSIAINGFTCFVVYQAVENAGYDPLFVDVAKNNLNFGIAELKAAHKQRPNLKAVIVQNTLGYPVDIEGIENYCKQNGLLLIEDLAHSLGARYADGREAGTVGDYAMLSFSQDKPMDVVAGGALIDRRSAALNDVILPPMSSGKQYINRIYPICTWLIRSTYALGLGRALHLALKKMHLLATPMSDNVKGLYAMTAMAQSLLIARWPKHEVEANHRKQIAQIYKQAVAPKVQFKGIDRGQPLCLRYPLHVNDRASLIEYLKKSGIFVGDTWYDAPIAPKRYLSKTDYKIGECPNAEDLAAHIVNLPTHRNVSEQQAKFLAEKVNAWLKLQ